MATQPRLAATSSSRRTEAEKRPKTREALKSKHNARVATEWPASGRRVATPESPRILDWPAEWPPSGRRLATERPGPSRVATLSTALGVRGTTRASLNRSARPRPGIPFRRRLHWGTLPPPP